MAKKRFDLKKYAWQRRERLYILTIAFVVLLSIPIGYRMSRRNEPVNLGVSFSVKYAEELGLNWKQAYLALLDEVGVKHLRLMSYWDVHEPANDEFMFEDLDWQIDQANRHGATVSLAVGQRQPRWPECHIPRWLEEVDDKTKQTQLLQYIDVVVTRYRDNPAVQSYQVENEAANRLFGDCPPYDPKFMEEEIALVRSLDPDAIVITNASNQSGTPLRGPVQSADKVGFSIYDNTHFEAFDNTYGWSFWYVPSHWHSFRAALVDGLPNKDTFIHELQAEPWGPEATVNLSLDEQNKTMNPEQLEWIVNYAKQTGMKDIYLWGGEWWYWRLTQFNDDVLWETVKDIYAENANEEAV